jgi:glycosyltransferase involved in cell wall biosynthesis
VERAEATMGEGRAAGGFVNRATLPFGVNVAGFVTTESGVGEAARANIRALAAAGLPVAVNNIECDLRGLDGSVREFSSDNPYLVNLVHVNADHGLGPVGLLGRDYFHDRFTIGFWYWELRRFREEWYPSFAPYREIWVASEFCLASIAAASPVPVVKIPPSLVPGEAGHLDRSRFGLKEEDFVFLFIFDVSSYVERKNPVGLIRAFRKPFRKDDRAVLLLKFTNSGHDRERVDLLEREAAGDRILLVDEYLDKPDLNALLRMCDCYVSLHRSEGFGLTMAEALHYGKPTIATAYGGNLEFMNVNNSYLVPFREVEIERTCGPYGRGWEWAEPDTGVAADLMRFVYENPDEARATGRRGAADIRRTLDPRATGELMKERLERLVG